MSEARRLPIYLLLDTSGSMMGDPIQSVQTGIGQLVADLMSSPRAIETAYISVITFGGNARHIAPLIELGQFQPPTLEAGGERMTGEALLLMERCLDYEVKRGSPRQQGDYRSLAFLLTDGVPEDEKLWDVMAERIKGRKDVAVVALAAGSRANTTVLKRLTNNVLQVADLQPEKLMEFFGWVSMSINLTSRSVGLAEADPSSALPPLPPGITILSDEEWFERTSRTSSVLDSDSPLELPALPSITIQWDDWSIKLISKLPSQTGNILATPRPPHVTIHCEERSIRLTSRPPEMLRLPPNITIVP